MFGVVLQHENNDHELNQWSFVLSHFQPDKVWIHGETSPNALKTLGAESLSALSSISSLGHLVVAAPNDGYSVVGEIPLQKFEHPKDAIYFFGSNHRHLESHVLQEVEYSAVYLDVPGHSEFWNFVAAAIFFWERIHG